MEIERKWLVDGFPEGLVPERTFRMRQGYVSTRPTVRIREEARSDGRTEWILTMKSSGTLSRKEIEILLAEEKFAELEDLIALPLIDKERRDYRIGDLVLEVSCVDEGRPTSFFYAEIEYPTEEEAVAWKAEDSGLSQYLGNAKEVTYERSESMAAYWERTRAGITAAGPR